MPFTEEKLIRGNQKKWVQYLNKTYPMKMYCPKTVKLSKMLSQPEKLDVDRYPEVNETQVKAFKDYNGRRKNIIYHSIHRSDSEHALNMSDAF